MSETLIEKLGVDKLPIHQRSASVTDLMDLRGKVAAVTAGAGPILGSAIVDRLASLGASLAVLDLDLDAAERVAERTSEKWGVAAKAFQLDATSPASIETAINAVESEVGPIDIWVNNLGLSGGQALFWERPLEKIDWIVSVTFSSMLYCSRLILPRMLERRSGRIINIASEAGKGHAVGMNVYNAAKSGVIGFTRNLAHDLKGTGVTTVAVCPGIMLTDFVIERLSKGTHAGSAIETVADWPAAGRGSLPEEVANMVAFLATDAGSYVQATAVSVGGGLSDL
jgi:NAD(P)-dependent dehydrogenase (short-subunit alcohol dehydrogenase family)